MKITIIATIICLCWAFRPVVLVDERNDQAREIHTDAHNPSNDEASPPLPPATAPASNRKSRFQSFWNLKRKMPRVSGIRKVRPAKTLRRWKYIVVGRFTCGDENSSESETEVKLVSHIKAGHSITMGKNLTDRNGKFCITGYATRKSPPVTYIHIYTTCKAKKKCYRRWQVPLPKEFVDSDKGYFFGIINMYTIFPGEDTSCSH